MGVSRAEAAVILGITVEKVAEMLAKGELQGKRTGHPIYGPWDIELGDQIRQEFEVKEPEESLPTPEILKQEEQFEKEVEQVELVTQDEPEDQTRQEFEPKEPKESESEPEVLELEELEEPEPEPDKPETDRSKDTTSRLLRILELKKELLALEESKRRKENDQPKQTTTVKPGSKWWF